MSDRDLVLRAADRLRALEAPGVGLSDIVAGEVRRLWVEEDCSEDRQVARAAFALFHPKASFFEVPKGKL